VPWLDRIGRHFVDQGFNDSGFTTRPSELFRRNCWISFEPVEGSLSVLADYIGPQYQLSDRLSVRGRLLPRGPQLEPCPRGIRCWPGCDGVCQAL